MKGGTYILVDDSDAEQLITFAAWMESRTPFCALSNEFDMWFQVLKSGRLIIARNSRFGLVTLEAR